MIYIAIVVFLCIMALVESVTLSRKLSVTSYLIALIIMIFLASARNNVGADWDAYLNFYQNTEESKRVELGYSYLNDLFSHLGVHFNVFLLFINVVCIALIASSLRHLQALCVVAVLYFYSDLFLYYNLSGIRQAIATAITCYAIRYAISRQALPFFALVAVAATFHMSAVIFMVAYFVPQGRFRWTFLVSLGLVGLLLYEFLYPITELITTYTLKNATYYVDYIVKEDDLITPYLVGLAKRLIVLGFVVVGRKNFKNVSYFQYVVNLYIIGVVIYMGLYLVSPDIGVRLSTYFTIFDIFIISWIIWREPRVMIRFGLASIICAISIYKIFGYARNPMYEYSIFF